MLGSVNIQRMLAGILALLVAAIVVVLVLLRAGGPSASEATAASSPYDGAALPAHLRAYDFALRDQVGRRVTLASDRGHVVVLTFIHSLCKDACPFMTEQIKGALNLLPHHGAGVRTIGISVDPRQDTERNRRRFLAKHEMTHRMAFVNGSEATMKRVWRGYDMAPETAHSEHSAFVLLVDRRGYERVGFAADELTPGGLAHDIRTLEAQRG